MVSQIQENPALVCSVAKHLALRIRQQLRAALETGDGNCFEPRTFADTIIAQKHRPLALSLALRSESKIEVFKAVDILKLKPLKDDWRLRWSHLVLFR